MLAFDLLALISQSTVVCSVFVLFVLAGLIAVVSPQVFGRVASNGSRWYDSSRILAAFDKRIDIDHYVLRHTRVFGFAVLISAVVLAYVYYQYFMV